MRRFIALMAASLVFATTAAADAPSARNVYVERRGLLEVDAQCHLFTPEVHAALQVTALQARGTLLRGGWSLAQVGELEQVTVAAARDRACTDPRNASAAATARNAYNTTFRSNAMEFPGWARAWSARRVAASDGWRLRQNINAPIAGAFGVRQLNGLEELILVLPTMSADAAPATAQLSLRNPMLPLGALDLTSRIAGGLDAGLPGPVNGMSIAGARRIEHPGWFQNQVVYVFPNSAFRTLCQLDPRETVAVSLTTPRGTQRILVEVGDIAAAAGFLATRAD
ncbi:MAG: hypothetical protein QM759_00560 [Terricaulis sp.]